MRELTLPELRLPEQVLERLDGLDPAELGIGARSQGDAVEVRRSPLELRTDSETGDPIVDGYASVWEHEYDVAGGPPYGWAETMARGAATKTLSERDENVAFLFDHEGIPLARVDSGTLTLEDEKHGLRSSARMDRESPHGLSVLRAIERGDVDEMSIAFRVVRQEWNEDYTERRISEIRLYDVSAVSFGANPATVIQARKAKIEAAEERGISTVLARALFERSNSPA
jgi:HK97 family phage prohead protease